MAVAHPGPGTRLLDIVLAASGLLVLLPVLVLLLLLVRLSSPGPAIYGSPRLGFGGGQFRAWKFRSMWHDAEQRLDEMLRSDPRARLEYDTYRKLRNDPRITPFGRILRRTSLDELPQLLNVLRGEMSLVGPRPKLLDEGHFYGHALSSVLAVRPGLTGLWQVSGRSKLTVEERVRLDLHYVRVRSLRGDLAIIGRTALQLLRPGRHGSA